MSVVDESRRRFIAAVGLGGALGLTGWSRAAAQCGMGDWGAIEDVGGAGGWTCATHPGFKILEIYLHLGASQWETLWLPGNGSPSLTDFGLGSLPLNQMDWLANTADFPCEAPDIPNAYDESALFAADSTGGNIYWGAPAKPLYRRADILGRARMVTQYHELAPHEAARPYALSGLTLGNARRAGTGTAIQRRHRVVDPTELLPVSYVLHPGVASASGAAAAVGIHPGSARPLVIQVRDDNAFYDSLARTGISAESDDLLLALRHEFKDRLRFRGAGDPVRSAGHDGYQVAADLLEDAPALQSLFGGNLLVIDSNVAVCPTHPDATANHRPATRTMLAAAASLLSSGPARYVCVIDSGLAGSYDTHGDGTQSHLLHSSANLYNVLHHLAAEINDPVENPSGSIDLNDTMVVINSEFGRTPYINANTGRDHWPYGYATLMIGGPISGPTIRGAIDTTDEMTVADHRYSATDIRGAMLLAAGVDPFAEGNFRFGDFSVAITDGIATDAGVRERLYEWILGQ